ncbi:MAG: hypothetical protein KDB23_33175, partial [Planctomycetales bacterium]|nr:hypothetical protein [Planctomycetales bacterium]
MRRSTKNALSQLFRTRSHASQSRKRVKRGLQTQSLERRELMTVSPLTTDGTDTLPTDQADSVADVVNTSDLTTPADDTFDTAPTDPSTKPTAALQVAINSDGQPSTVPIFSERTYVVDEVSAVALNQDGLVVASVEQTDGRVHVVEDSASGNFAFVDQSEVQLFDAGGASVARVTGLSNPAVEIGEEGKAWIIDDGHVILLGKDGKPIAQVNTDGRGELVRGEDGAWWVVDKSSVTCFDKDGKKLG